MKNLFGKTLILVLGIFLVTGCGKSGAVEIGDKAPDFTLQNMDGKPTNFSEFKGKVVILDFFASWCPPCRQEIPDFIELQKTYGNEGFTMVGVSLVSGQESKDFAAQTGINYPVLVDDGNASGLYGPIRSIPPTFVITKDSKIAKIYIGYRPKAVFENDIKELLK
ncbi:MAG: TlpA disulfide reductase family protein [Candidatus Omnitrophota bacterium]|nr:TlpA disulfide reductase family protein [Candidatus Omnitrophota bacterium]